MGLFEILEHASELFQGHETRGLLLLVGSPEPSAFLQLLRPSLRLSLGIAASDAHLIVNKPLHARLYLLGICEELGNEVPYRGFYLGGTTPPTVRHSIGV
jgi:hypothetical protein